MNHNLKRFIGYLFYVAAFGYIVIKVNDYHRYLQESLSYYKFGPLPLFIFMAIFPIIVGFLIALPQFVRTLWEKGSWKIDWVMLLTVGLPALFIAMTPLIPHTPFAFHAKFILFITGKNPNLITIAGIVFGFMLIASLRKQEPDHLILK